MKITFSASAFAEAAKIVRNVRDASLRIDILDHALVAVEGETLALTMSDTDMEVRALIDCTGDTDVRAAIPAAVLDFFVVRAAAGEAEASMEFDDAMLNVTARHGKARMTMAILQADIFPVFDTASTTWSLPLRAHELCTLFSVTQKAIAVDKSRAYLEGVFLNSRDGELTAVALDGHRMHVATVDLPPVEGNLPMRAAGLPGVIIPAGAVIEILKIFSGDESEVRVSGTESKFVVEGERIRIASKLIDGTYPDYARLLVEPGEFRLGVESAQLEQALASLAVIPRTDGKGKALQSRAIQVTAEPDAILIETRGDSGDADIRVPATIEGQGHPFGVNARLLREAVAAAGGGKIVIAPAGEQTQALRLLPQAEGRAFIVMQMRY